MELLVRIFWKTLKQSKIFQKDKFEDFNLLEIRCEIFIGRKIFKIKDNFAIQEMLQAVH